MAELDQELLKPNRNSSIVMSLNLKYVCLALLLIIIGMLAVWKPWSSDVQDNSRVVKVTGTAKVTAVPDEFVFYPTYEFKNANKDAALAALTKKSEELIKKLKELGVADNKIKTNSDGYSSPTVEQDSSSVLADPENLRPVEPGHIQPKPQGSTYTLRMTITAGNKELATKVQDYLVTTAPTGSVSPQANFSDAKRKELEQKARDTATKEARTKAEQSAKNLGFKIGKVKSIDDGNGFSGCGANGICFGSAQVAEDSGRKALAVQPGENELDYSVIVEYYIN